jgi:hypothetical protein
MTTPGAAADVTEVLDGGIGPFVGSGRPLELPRTWMQEERVAAGTATSYRAVGDPPVDGRVELAPDVTAEYRTRILVRRPSDAGEFNGTVVVEWLNVSGGLDADADHTLLADELQRRGYAWVGVSAQLIGIEGGPALVSAPGGEGIVGVGLKKIDPERYGSLEHPGDAFSYDIYTQVARAVRAGTVLGELVPERVLAAGESQSAFALTTYVNGVHPQVEVHDGFLVHSRGRGTAPLGVPGAGIDMMSAMLTDPTVIRTDLATPVLVLETETDLFGLGYFWARQDDTTHIRVWEVAGTAHADRYMAAIVADAMDCGGPINEGPHHFVAKAALRALDDWVRTGTPPPSTDRLEVDDTPALRRDDDGIALGGIRTPQVDVPLATLSGDARSSASLMCLLFGSTTPLSPERVLERYGTKEAYFAEYEAATDATIAAGHLLAEDRDAVLADARPERFGPSD